MNTWVADNAASELVVNSFAGEVFATRLIPPITAEVVVEPAGAVATDPEQVQSPGVRDTEVIFLNAVDTIETALPWGISDAMTSPMFPAAAAALLATPTCAVVGIKPELLS
jgi:hypothetical protein